MSFFGDNNCFIIFIRTISPPYHCHKKISFKSYFFFNSSSPHFDDSPAGWGVSLINQVIIFFHLTAHCLVNQAYRLTNKVPRVSAVD